MQHRALAFLLVLIASISTTPVVAQQNNATDDAEINLAAYAERLAMTVILDAAKKNTKKSFLVNRHAPRDLAVGNIDIRDIDYGVLLQILRNNDLAAVTIDGMVNVIPVGIVRQYALPEMSEHKNALGDEEWVTGVIKVENAPAASFIPLMRPIMPRAGHLAANPDSNSIIIVDRLGNARRIAALIKKMDQATPSQSE